MPIPIILAVAAGVAGIGGGIRGGVKMKDAKDTQAMAEKIQNEAIAKYNTNQKKASKKMDALGNKEITVLKDLNRFNDIYNKLQNCPDMPPRKIKEVEIPKYDAEKIEKISIGAGVLFGGLGSAALGTAGGFAAAGATTAAVAALGTASTGAAISSLSGAAATNAVLAALGGGAAAAGGGGIAAGTAVLGAATMGVGLLIGGLVFNFTGGHLSKKADEAYSQAKKTQSKVNKICDYFNLLIETADKYLKVLNDVSEIYCNEIGCLDDIVNIFHKTDWNDFDDYDKNTVTRISVLIRLLVKLCSVNFVLTVGDKDNPEYKVNEDEINKNIEAAETIIKAIDDDFLFEGNNDEDFSTFVNDVQDDTDCSLTEENYVDIFNTYIYPEKFLINEYMDSGTCQLVTEYSFGRYPKKYVAEIFDKLCELYSKAALQNQISEKKAVDSVKLLVSEIKNNLMHDTLYDKDDSIKEQIINNCLNVME